MANWCENRIRIFGAKENVNLFVENLQNKGFDDVLPTPEELNKDSSPSSASKKEKEKRIKKYGYDNWYEWRLAKWGVKWNPKDIKIISSTDECIRVSFFTTYNPAFKWAREAAKKYNVSIEYSSYCPDSGVFLFCKIDKDGECDEVLGGNVDVSENTIPLLLTFFSKEELIDEYANKYLSPEDYEDETEKLDAYYDFEEKVHEYKSKVKC